jgi:hypothetical protein
MIACSECLFENSAECPLTRLLNRKHEVHEGEIENEGPRGRPMTCSWEKEGESVSEDDKVSGSSRNKSSNDDNHAEAVTAENEPEDLNLGLAEADICPQCCQQQCCTCEPGYMKLIVDMKEFPKTFAEEMRHCTLCEHQQCPGSALVVKLQCRECAHEQCNDCGKMVDTLGEDCYVCCRCEKKTQEHADEIPASGGDQLHQEEVVEDSKNFTGNQARKGGETEPQAVGANTQSAREEPVSSNTGGDRGFPAWLVGEEGAEASATRMRRTNERVWWSSQEAASLAAREY